MPKIRDLGINAIPETMRPPEIGPGGGGGGGWGWPPCPDTSPGTTGWWVQFPPCPNTSPTNTGFWMQTPCPDTSPGTTGYWMCGQTQNCPDTSPAHNTSAPDCPGLTREQIRQLKQQLYSQIEQLDEYAKNVGPKTIEQIDAREKELREELEELAARRKQLENQGEK